MSFKTAVITKLALRNLRRQARRSLLTAASMIAGGALLIFSLILGDGTHEQWIDSAVRMADGHLTIQSPRFQGSRALKDRMPGESRAFVEQALLQGGIVGEIRVMAPRLAVTGMASSAAGARPARILGVDPAVEVSFSVLDEKVRQGRYLRPGDRLAAYVGVGLLEALDLRLGSKFVLTAQDAGGEIAGQLVRVVGTFRTGIPEVDRSLLHIPLSTAGAWLGCSGDVTSMGLLLGNSEQVPQVRRSLQQRLSETHGTEALRALSWRESLPELDAAVKIDDFSNYLFQGILFGIIALGIVNTVLMSVMYRRREFGVLQALGLTPGQSASLVLVEGLILTVLSGTIGIALGLSVTWFLWGEGLDLSSMMDNEWTFSGVVMEPVVVPRFRVARMVQGLSFIFLIGMLASLYPALRAMRIDVAETMKFER